MGLLLNFSNNSIVFFVRYDSLCIFAIVIMPPSCGEADDRAFRWKLSHFKIFGKKQAVGNGQKNAHACDIVT